MEEPESELSSLSSSQESAMGCFWLLRKAGEDLEGVGLMVSFVREDSRSRGLVSWWVGFL